MEREYPEILNCKTEPHPVQFLPECYLYGELTSKVYYNVFLESKNITFFRSNVILFPLLISFIDSEYNECANLLNFLIQVVVNKLFCFDLSDTDSTFRMESYLNTNIGNSLFKPVNKKG
jgi:hypothetical protein